MSGKRALVFLSFWCLLWMVACGGTGATSETQVVELATATKAAVYSPAEATVTESAPAETPPSGLFEPVSGFGLVIIGKRERAAEEV